MVEVADPLRGRTIGLFWRFLSFCSAAKVRKRGSTYHTNYQWYLVFWLVFSVRRVGLDSLGGFCLFVVLLKMGEEGAVSTRISNGSLVLWQSGSGG